MKIEIGVDPDADYERKIVPAIVTPYLKDRRTAAFWEQLNALNGVLSHGVGVESARRTLTHSLAVSLPKCENIQALYEPNEESTLHDFGKYFLDKDLQLALAYLYPEKYLGVRQNDPFDHGDNRPPEIRKIHLLHPIIALYALIYSGEIGVIPKELARANMNEAAGHHETAGNSGLISYPRLASRDNNHTRRLIGRLADLMMAIGVEERPHRQGVVSRNIQEKIFAAVLPDPLMDVVRRELGIDPKKIDAEELRLLFIENIFDTEDRLGIMPADGRIGFLDTPKRNQEFPLQDFSCRLWEIFGRKIEARGKVLRGYQAMGLFEDKLRLIQ